MFWGRAGRPVPHLRAASAPDGRLREHGPPASRHHGDGQLRLLQCPRDRPLLSLVEDRDWGRRDFTPVDPADRSSRWRRSVLWLATADRARHDDGGRSPRSHVTVIFPDRLERSAAGSPPSEHELLRPLRDDDDRCRPEILVEGSHDGETWTEYPFRWKPGNVGRAPGSACPTCPASTGRRPAALSGDCRRQPWFLAFERRLLEGSPDVLALLASDPFPDAPPRYLRARLSLYRFTGRRSSAWWRREDVGLFCPPITIDLFRGR